MFSRNTIIKVVFLQSINRLVINMKFEAVTIKDIAKELGLSTSTVSRALRDSYEISTETKQSTQYCIHSGRRPWLW